MSPSETGEIWLNLPDAYSGDYHEKGVEARSIEIGHKVYDRAVASHATWEDLHAGPPGWSLQ